MKQRRTLFIDKTFQGRFIVWLLAVIVLFACFSALLLYLLIASDLESQTQAAHVNIKTVWKHLGFSIMVSNFIATLIAGFLTAMIVLYVSHKIAGPMYRLQQLFKEVGQGNLDVPLKLRQNDQIKNLLDSFGGLVKKLREQRQQRKTVLNKAHETITRLKQSGERTPEDQQLLEQLEQELKHLE